MNKKEINNKRENCQKAIVVSNHQRKLKTLVVSIKHVVKYDKYAFTSEKEKRLLIHFDSSKFNFSENEINDPGFLLNKSVLIKSCKPMSRQKRFELYGVLS